MEILAEVARLKGEIKEVNQEMLKLKEDAFKIKGVTYYDFEAERNRKGLKSKLFVLRMHRGKLSKKLDDLATAASLARVNQLDIFNS